MGMNILVAISHLLIVFNCSLNCFIYCGKVSDFHISMIIKIIITIIQTNIIIIAIYENKIRMHDSAASCFAEYSQRLHFLRLHAALQKGENDIFFETKKMK